MVSGYRIHQYAMPSLVLSKSSFDVEVIVFYKVLLSLDQSLSNYWKILFADFETISYTFLVHFPVLTHQPLELISFSINQVKSNPNGLGKPLRLNSFVLKDLWNVLRLISILYLQKSILIISS